MSGEPELKPCTVCLGQGYLEDASGDFPICAECDGAGEYYLTMLPAEKPTSEAD